MSQQTVQRTIGIDEFVRELRHFPTSAFDRVDDIAGFLTVNAVAPDTLAPYLTWDGQHYTRNLIYKGDLFELIALCWEVGQVSRIHNHQGQRCWMAVPIGCLAVQNYTVVRAGDRGYCELREADRLVMDPRHPSAVAPETSIHAVLNLPEYGSRKSTIERATRGSRRGFLAFSVPSPVQTRMRSPSRPTQTGAF